MSGREFFRWLLTGRSPYHVRDRDRWADERTVLLGDIRRLRSQLLAVEAELGEALHHLNPMGDTR